MIAVHYFENKKEIVRRLQDTLASKGDNIRLKGRNGKVLSIVPINERNVYVHVYLEPKKPKFIFVDPKKNRRR